MARRSQTQRLNIWMNGLPVGYWEKAREGDRLSYLDEWIEDEITEWTSGDQLAFYANKDEREVHPKQATIWPGVSAGQGTSHAKRWRGSFGGYDTRYA